MANTPLLTQEDLSDPLIKKSLDKLQSLEAFSKPFNNLKESLEDYMILKHKEKPNWGNYWMLEQAIFTFLFGEGHA